MGRSSQRGRGDGLKKRCKKPDEQASGFLQCIKEEREKRGNVICFSIASIEYHTLWEKAWTIY